MPRRVSNPQYHQASGRRPTPLDRALVLEKNSYPNIRLNLLRAINQKIIYFCVEFRLELEEFEVCCNVGIKISMKYPVFIFAVRKV
jgi:hypothetical protein